MKAHEHINPFGIFRHHSKLWRVHRHRLRNMKGYIDTRSHATRGRSPTTGSRGTSAGATSASNDERSPSGSPPRGQATARSTGRSQSPRLPRGHNAPREIADRRRIERENRKLAEDLFKIMAGHGVVTESLMKAPEYQHPGTINFQHRLAEAKRIYNENRFMAYRLDNIKAHYGAAINIDRRPVKLRGGKASARNAPSKRDQNDATDTNNTGAESSDVTAEDSNAATGRTTTTNAVAEEDGSSPRASSPPRAISPSPRPPSSMHSPPPSRSSSSRASRIYMANTIVLTMPNAPRYDRMHTAPSSKARRLSSMHGDQQSSPNREPHSPAPHNHVKPKNLILEHWKIQDGNVLEVAVLKAPFEDQFSILGIDNTNNRKFQLDVSSEEVTNALEGDMLVTSLDNLDVWKAFLEKVQLGCVSEFARPGTSRSNKPQTAPQASPQMADADWTDAFAPSPLHDSSSVDARGVNASPQQKTADDDISEFTAPPVSVTSNALSPIRDEEATIVSAVTEEGDYDDYNEDWGNADAISVPMQTVNDALGLDKSIESYYAEDTFEDIVPDSNSLGYDTNSPAYTGVVVNKSSDMLVVPPPFDAPARPITADRFKHVSTAERRCRSGQGNMSEQNEGQGDFVPRPSVPVIPPLPLNGVKPGTGKGTASQARPNSRRHSIIAPPPIIKIKHVIIVPPKKKKVEEKGDVHSSPPRKAPKGVAPVANEEDKEQGALKIESIRKPSPRRGQSSPTAKPERPPWNDSSVIPAPFGHRDQSVIRGNSALRRKYKGETYANASALSHTIKASSKQTEGATSSRSHEEGEQIAGNPAIEAADKGESTEVHHSTAAPPPGGNSNGDATTAFPHPPAGPKPSASVTRPGNSNGSRPKQVKIAATPVIMNESTDGHEKPEKVSGSSASPEVPVNSSLSAAEEENKNDADVPVPSPSAPGVSDTRKQEVPPPLDDGASAPNNVDTKEAAVATVQQQKESTSAQDVRAEESKDV